MVSVERTITESATWDLQWPARHDDTGIDVPQALTGVSGPTADTNRTVATIPTVATIILPAFNEAAALPEVLTALFALLDDRYEVIVVDDASSDDTAAIARGYPCHLLRHAQNQGKGAAVRTGLKAARGHFIVVMDADNTYPAEAVPHIVALSHKYDFVRGVRRYGASQMPLVNRIGNKIFDTMLKVVHGLEGSDHLTGLYGLRREALDAMDLTAERFDLEVEIAIKARALRLRASSVPIMYGQRLGEKKLRAWRDGWHILRRSLALAVRYHPCRQVSFPGCSDDVPAATASSFPTRNPG